MKKPYYTQEVITPEKALEYACLSIGNRHIRDAHVAMLAAAMVRGEYRINNNNNITFDVNNALIDGHHRLLAVVAAGVPVVMGVMRDVAPEARDTIDIGPPRTLADHLTFMGVDNAAQRSGIISGCVRIVVGTSVKVANAEGYGQWQPLFEKGTEAYFRLGCGHSKHMRTSKCASPLIVAHKANPEKMEEFFVMVRDGANLGVHHPALRLRESLLMEMSGDLRRKDNTEDTHSRVFAAAKAFLDGRTVQKLQVSTVATQHFKSFYSRGNAGKQSAEVKQMTNTVRALTDKISFSIPNGGVPEELRGLTGKEIMKKVSAVPPIVRCVTES